MLRPLTGFASAASSADIPRRNPRGRNLAELEGSSEERKRRVCVEPTCSILDPSCSARQSASDFIAETDFTRTLLGLMRKCELPLKSLRNVRGDAMLRFVCGKCEAGSMAVCDLVKVGADPVPWPVRAASMFVDCGQLSSRFGRGCGLSAFTFTLWTWTESGSGLFMDTDKTRPCLWSGFV